MKVTTEKMENCQMALTVEVEADELDKSLDTAYRHLVNRVSVPGFRKGKTPRAILEQHVGKGTLLEEALDRLVPQLYQKALEQEKVEPLDEPHIEMVQTEPVIFKAIVPLRPEVELGDYHGVRVDSEPVEVGEKEIEAALERIQQGQAIWNPVDRPVAFGDLVSIDVEATMEDKPFLNHKSLMYEVDENSDWPLPGVAQNLAGAEKNKVTSFEIAVPSDYGIKEFAGKNCSFKVTVTEIKVKELPALANEFAQSAGYDDLANMREKVASDLKAMAEMRKRQELRQKTLDAVVELSKVNYPPVVEGREIDSLIRKEARQLGFDDVEEYLKRTSRTREEYGEQVRPIVRKRINHTLILDEVVEQEKIEINAAEVDNKAEEIIKGAEDQDKAREFFALPQVKGEIEQSLRTQKALDLLVEIAAGSAKSKVIEERIAEKAEEEKVKEEVKEEVGEAIKKEE